MANVFKEASVRMFTYPLRILIIINSLLVPILLGIIVFFIFKFKKPVEDILDKAIGIEKYVEDKIHLGIEIIFDIFQNIQDLTNIDKITTFLNDELLPSISTRFEHFCHQNGLKNFSINNAFDIKQANKVVEDIKTTFTNLTHFDIADLQLNKLSDDLTTVLIDQFNLTTSKQKDLLKEFLKQNFTIANILTYGILYSNHLDGIIGTSSSVSDGGDAMVDIPAPVPMTTEDEIRSIFAALDQDTISVGANEIKLLLKQDSSGLHVLSHDGSISVGSNICNGGQVDTTKYSGNAKILVMQDNNDYDLLKNSLYQTENPLENELVLTVNDFNYNAIIITSDMFCTLLSKTS